MPCWVWFLFLGFLACKLIGALFREARRTRWRVKPHCGTRPLRVLVTGGTRGIGFELAVVLAWKHRCLVTICGRTESGVEKALKAATERGVGLFGTACDVSIKESVDNLWDYAAKKMGGVDVMFCNAAVADNQRVPPWDRIKEVPVITGSTITGPMLCSLTALHHFISTDCKADVSPWVFVMEGYGTTEPPRLGHGLLYGSCKRGLRFFTDSLVLHLNDLRCKRPLQTVPGICTINPGMVLTPNVASSIREHFGPNFSSSASTGIKKKLSRWLTSLFLNVICDTPDRTGIWLADTIVSIMKQGTSPVNKSKVSTPLLIRNFVRFCLHRGHINATTFFASSS
ncbi:hypothetical protein Pelo_7668 [Pelomyxa schiedti]|nr:hypothetical protein Pelo_7668 [Pelomyxa schiedti]